MTLLTRQAVPNELAGIVQLVRGIHPNRLVVLQMSALLVATVFLSVTVTGLWLAKSSLLLMLCLLCVVAIVALALSAFVALPILHPARTRPQYTPANFGWHSWENVHFDSSDHLRLQGWFIPPDSRCHGATLIFVHGLGSNRGELLGEALALARHGYGALLFDLRSHGSSQGTLSTLGYHEVNDIRGAVRYLFSRPEVNRQRIGLVGHSIGAVASLRAAARIPAIRAVVAESAFDSLPDNIAQGLVAKTGLPPFLFAPIVMWLGERVTGVSADHLRPIQDVARIAPRAVLFVHGSQDPLVNVENSRRLYRAASEPKSLVIVRGAKHSDLFRSAPVSLERRLVEFFDRQLLSRSSAASPVQNERTRQVMYAGRGTAV